MPLYTVKPNLTGISATNMVVDTDSKRILGGFGSNYHRSWVFPLYTPSGMTVVREFPFDHPFHNGVFIGQNPVRVGGRVANYWALPVTRSADDHIMVNIGRMDPVGEIETIIDDSVTFSLRSTWLDENGDPMLDEKRVVRFQSMDDATICDVTSMKTAAYGAVECSQTKFGTIGMRVEERLLPALGGEVISSLDGEIRRGTADEVANHMACDAIAYENSLAGTTFGVCMMIRDNTASTERRGPWFIRDYGMAMFNATQDDAVHIPDGETWTASLRVVAYDGALTPERITAYSQM